MKYTDEGMLNLRNAIIEQAAKDYLRSKIKQIKNPTNNHYIIEVEIIRKWFKSDKFDDLCTNYSGDYFIKNLDKLAEEYAKPIMYKQLHGVAKNKKIDLIRRKRITKGGDNI